MRSCIIGPLTLQLLEQRFALARLPFQYRPPALAECQGVHCPEAIHENSKRFLRDLGPGGVPPAPARGGGGVWGPPGGGPPPGAALVLLGAALRPATPGELAVAL